MERLDALIRLIHILAGTVAVCSLWLPLFSRKGGRLHRRAGWLFTSAMAAVAISALVRCAIILLGAGPGVTRALYLAFIAVLSASLTWQGIQALRAQGTPRTLDRVPALLLGSSAIAATLYGLALRAPLFVIFGVLGLFLAYRMLAYWLRSPASHVERVTAHLNAMIGSCAAALTALAVVNAQHLGLDAGSVWVWVAPGALFTAIGSVIRRRYQRQSRAPSSKLEVRSVQQA